MRSTATILTGCLIVLLSGISLAFGNKETQQSLQVTVNKDSVVISIENSQGQRESVALDAQTFSDSMIGAGFMIENELYIDEDKITIDGVEFATSDIQKLLISRDNEKTITFRATLPDDNCPPPENRRVIRVDRSSDKDRMGFSGLVILKDEIVRGDAVALTGDVKVFGKVYGDIVSVFGDIFIYDGSYAGGDVVTPFGKVITSGDYQIKGDLSGPYCEPKPHKTDVNISARFDRVEGFTPMIDIRFRDSERELPNIDFGLSYGLALKKWNVDFGFKQNIGIGSPFYFGGKLYRGAFTPDQWYFDQTENTVAGLFFKEDYHDFYWRKGGRFFLGREFWKNGFAQTEITAQTNSPLSRHVKNAIFGGHKKFRENYSTVLPDSAIIQSLDGNLQMLGLRLGWDSRDPNRSYHRGQYFCLSLETAGDGSIGDLGGDFSYNILEAEIQHNQQVSNRQYLGLRFKGGLSNQTLPLDRWFFQGGVGTLRGYDFKEFAGNRYFLTSIDYYWEFSKDFALALFTDLGQSGFSQSDFQNTGLKSDLGVGLILGESIRLDLAQRLDDTGKSPIIMARILETF